MRGENAGDYVREPGGLDCHVATKSPVLFASVATFPVSCLLSCLQGGQEVSFFHTKSSLLPLSLNEISSKVKVWGQQV